MAFPEPLQSSERLWLVYRLSGKYSPLQTSGGLVESFAVEVTDTGLAQTDPPVKITIDDSVAEIHEDERVMTFSVRLDRGATQTITVDYATASHGR